MSFGNNMVDLKIEIQLVTESFTVFAAIVSPSSYESSNFYGNISRAHAARNLRNACAFAKPINSSASKYSCNSNVS